MSRSLTILASSAALLLAASPAAFAADLPAIKLSESNKVPECATPGRLMSYLKDRNPALDPKFEGIATDYMRYGEQLGLRWDYAFFQMILETNSLKYTGIVKPDQNNFAGMGATGRGNPGESFKSVSDGVLAHAQHILMYSGDKIESPVAERTRNIQEWGVLGKWQATITGPMTYAQLAKQWAPTTATYSRSVEKLASIFYSGACNGADPNPEMVQEARGGVETNGKVASAGKGANIAKQAVAQQRDGGVKSGLGAENLAKETHDATNGSVAAGPPVKLLNAPVAEAAAEPLPDIATPETMTDAAPAKIVMPAKAETAKAAPVKAPVKAEAAKVELPKAEAPKKTAESPKAEKPKAEKVAQKPKAEPQKAPAAVAEPAPEADKSEALAEKSNAPSDTAPTRVAALSVPKAESKKAAAVSSKCRVFTASYGGTKSIIIKALADGVTNFTVLDVNDGSEKREADAYIGAYAKGGEPIGDPQNQDKALEKAFELCPEG